ncbi:MAG: right-handed parallel beta-helix repeat-containing protein [candidate division Zixibacteria bacterium]|nr:right-handed parallel beta-helix repeat-containing protein [candidate division Zixibacteria bacterium]
MGKRSRSEMGWAPIATAIGAVALSLLVGLSSSEAAGRRKSVRVWINLPPQFTVAPSSVNGETGKWCSIVVKAEDSDGSIPSITAYPIPEGAWFADRGDGSAELGFIPTLGQVGKSMLYFVASDGRLADTTVVWLIITEGPGTRHAPILRSLLPEVFIEVGNPTSFNVSATDSDGTIPAFFVDSLPANSSFIDRGSGYGTFSITPTSGQAGRITLTFIASDGVLADSAVVVLVINEPVYYPPDTIQGVSFQADLIASFTSSGAIDQLRAEDMDGDGLAEVLYRVTPFGSTARLEIWDPTSGGQIGLPAANAGIKSYSLRARAGGLEPLLLTDSGRVLVLNPSRSGWDSVATLPPAARQFQWLPSNPRGWQLCYLIGNGYNREYTDPMGWCTYHQSGGWTDTWVVGADGSAGKLERVGDNSATPNSSHSSQQIITNRTIAAVLLPSLSSSGETKSGSYCNPTNLFFSGYGLDVLSEGAGGIEHLRWLWNVGSPDFYGPQPVVGEYLIGVGLWHHGTDSSLEIAYVDNVWPYRPSYSHTRWKLVTHSVDRQSRDSAVELNLQPYFSRGGLTRVDASSPEVMIVAADTGLAYTLSIPDANLMGKIRLPRAGKFLTAYTMDQKHRDLIFKSGESIEIYRVKTVIVARPSSITIRVPVDRPAIQSAINWAQHGDTVLVAPGNYRENIDFLGKRITVMGFPDSVRPVLEPRDSSIALVLFESSEPRGTVLEGFTVVGGGTDNVVRILNRADPTIRNNVFTYCRRGGMIIDCEGRHATVSGNLFVDNANKRAVDAVSGDVEIINNTFDRNWSAIHDEYGVATIRNNVICNSQAYGVHRQSRIQHSGILDYNDIWNNHPDYIGGARAGIHDISFDPQYIIANGSDYRLSTMSLCVDNGDPDSPYLDPDGTVADIGAYPLDRSSRPRPTGLAIEGENRLRVVNHTPKFRWGFRGDAGNSQIAFEIQVGNDPEWDSAAYWISGGITSSDTEVVYNGLPLADGIECRYRVRVNDGVNWGPWFQSFFRMNTAPSAPTRLFPSDSSTVSAEAAQLAIRNSTDAQADSLKYDFAVYSDPGLTSEVFNATNVPEQLTNTWTIPMSTLEKGHQYLWRARASDGFEFSAWSVLGTFQTNSAVTIRIPDDQPTIQAGIQAAGSRDTVLVGAGNYKENLDFLGKRVVVTSTQGPMVTIIRPADSMQPIVSFNHSEPRGATLVGFTITGAKVTAIVADGSSPSIISNVITGNTATGYYYEAGGIRLRNTTGALIRGNVIHGNTGRAYAGGIQLESCHGDTISFNVLYDNLGIGDIRCFSTTATILNNTISVTTWSGVLVYGFSGSPDTVWVLNNIVFFSKADAINAQQGGIVAAYNCGFANASNGTLGPGSIALYAQFVDSSKHNYSLLPTSPCIDAGDPDPRFNDPDGSRNDIGSIPYVSSMSNAEHPSGDTDILSVIDLIAKRTSEPSAAPSAAELAAMINRLFGPDNAGGQPPANPPPR